MISMKVVEWVDIGAPRQDVFNLIVNLERRQQLSPLWGFSRILEMSPEFPREGSRYRVQFLQGDGSQHEVEVTGLVAGRKFSYRLYVDQQSVVSWTLQDSAAGTRLVYEEEFLSEEENSEQFSQSVREVVRKWLANIKRYSELRQSRGQRLVKWMLDRFYLRLRQDQRKVVQTILFMQVIGTISFLMAAIALGIASLV